jgi:hypothetical protein
MEAATVIPDRDVDAAAHLTSPRGQGLGRTGSRLIRVIVADSDRSPVTHVFTTVDGACRCVHELLDELDPDPRGR